MVTAGPLSLRQKGREETSSWGKDVDGAILPLQEEETTFY